jgi:DNA polymerase-3 subunit epsilon
VRICGIDLETTGLDLQKDFITEIAWIIKDVGDSKNLVQHSSLVITPLLFIPDEITLLTKITKLHLDAAGRELKLVLNDLFDDLENFKVDYIVAHNGENFDKPMLFANAQRVGWDPARLSVPWLDTRNDIVFPPAWTSRRLSHLAAELGFLNPFPHSALFDVATMLKVLEHFNIDDVIRRSQEPWVVLRALTNYDEREKAKQRRFSWERCGDKTYPKCWVKRVKASDVPSEKAEADFEITIIE